MAIVNGDAGDNNLSGTQSPDTVDGGGGNDTLQGLGGNDLLRGGSGDDSLLGGAGQDTLIGGAGNDTIDGGTITDLVNYTDLNFLRFDPTAGAVNVNLQSGVVQDGQGGTDSVTNVNFVVGTAGNDTITGSDGNLFEQFEGGDGDDVIDGGAINAGNNFMGARVNYQFSAAAVSVDLAAGTATGQGNDSLANISQVRGSAQGDTLFGSNATDYVEAFEGRAGNDYIDGRGGIDQYRADGTTKGININLATGAVAQDGFDGQDTVVGIENVRGTAFGDVITGDAGNNVLDGREGNDTLTGGLGDDVINGGSSFNDMDFAVYSGAAGDVEVDLVEGRAYGAEGNDTLTGIEGVVTGAGNDFVLGSDANNWIRGEAGDDTLHGGSGFDTLDYRTATDAVQVNLADGTVTGAHGNDEVYGFEQVRGGSGNDLLVGDAGNNWLRGMAGDDTLDGGDGIDTADYSESTAGVEIDLIHQQQVAGPNGADTLLNIENVRGSNHADLLIGDEGHNVLEGLGGNDTLEGDPGNDALYGGDGDDEIHGDTGDDRLNGGAGNDLITGGAGNDSFDASGYEGGGNDTIDGGDDYDSVFYGFWNATGGVNFTLVDGGPQDDGNGGFDELTNIEEVHVYGSSFDDAIFGNSLRNWIVGNEGNDTLAGGGGSDTFAWDISRSSGIDRVEDFSAGEELTFNDSGMGFALTGVNQVEGPGSLMRGGVYIDAPVDGITRVHIGTDDTAGADLTIDLVGEFSASDFLIQNNPWGGTLRYEAGQVLTGGEGNDFLMGGEAADTISGNGGDDNLNGNGGGDSIDGGAGNDFINGGPGDDTLQGGEGNDYIQAGGMYDGGFDVVDGGAGYDTAQYGYQDAMGPVHFVSSGAGPQYDPLGGTDTLIGIEEVHVFGSAFDDTIEGAAERNYLVGGAGNDILHGWGGPDSFVYDAAGNNGIDTIMDFEAGDNIQVDGLALTGTILDGDDASGLGMGQVMVGTSGVGTRLYIGIDDNAGADLVIDLAGSFQASNFTTYSDPMYGSSIMLVDGPPPTPTEGDDSLSGGFGHDYIDGLGGNDTITGQAGNDMLFGGDGNDQIAGGANDDRIDGGAGNDALDGGDGYDVLQYDLTGAAMPVTFTVTADFSQESSAQDDGMGGTDMVGGFEEVHISGSAFADTITGGNGREFIEGGAGDDSLTGGGGSDTFGFHAANASSLGEDHITDLESGDSLHFRDLPITSVEAGDGTGLARGQVAVGAYDVDTNTTRVYVGTDDTAGADIVIRVNDRIEVQDLQVYNDGHGNLHFVPGMEVTGTEGTDFLEGGGSQDTLDGLGGNDNLNGYGGNDLLRGGEGDDFLMGFEGADTLDGGNGIDMAAWFDAGSGVNVDLTLGTTGGAAAGDVLVGIENLGGTSHADTLIGDNQGNYIDGSDGDDHLQGMGGDDNLHGGVGNDTLDGGAGVNDRASFYSASGAVTVNLLTQSATGGAGNDVLLGIEHVEGSNHGDHITGDGGNNALSGNDGNDTLIGGGGSDFLVGGAGDDSIDGGAGNDFVDYTFAGGPVQVNLATGVVTGAAGNDSVTGVENVRGSDGDDHLVGDAAANSLEGGAGDDLMEGGGGRDFFVGGAGDDTIDGGAILDRTNYTDLNSVNYASSSSGIDLNLQSGVVQDGMGGVDQLSNINFVTGSAHGDAITGSNALNLFEQFEGGLGDDTIDGGTIDLATQSNANRVTYASAGGAVTVHLWEGRASGAAGNDSLSNINHVTGGSFADSLVGSDSAFSEEFEGRGGNDTIDGLGGFDMVRYDGSGSAVNANLATGEATDGWGTTDTLRNIEGLRGSAGNDTLVGGNAASDALEVFVGGGGNDSIDGGSGYDRVQFNTATTGVVVTLGGTGEGSASDGTGGTDRLFGIEAVRGTAFGDTLTGSDSGAFESFDGRGGNDVIDGRGGIDRVEYAGENAAVNVDLGAGTASGATAGSDTLSNIEDVLGSRFADTIVGSAEANDIQGGAGNDTIDGAGGYDTAVFAGNGADYTITRGAGGITVTGADGTDLLTGIERLQFSDGDVLLGSVASDFDGDGQSDLLWRNAGTGANAIWLGADGDAGQEVVGADANWKVAGIGDFNGDGEADLLWRNSASGVNVIWRSGDSADAQAVETVADADWQVAGVADFNGDGQDDILWRNRGTGENTIWQGADVNRAQYVDPVTDTNWKAAAVGDFNGDGVDDILWRNAVTGDNVIWQSAYGGAVQVVAGIPDSAWKAAAVGDFNGDGADDILWRNATTGENAIWRSGDYQQVQAVDPVSSAWTLAAVGDYDGDGTDDIVWRNGATGENVIWGGASSSDAHAVYAVEGGNRTLPAQTDTAATTRSADFDLDGDGLSDLLWRNEGSGTNVAWGGASDQNAQAVDGIPDADWKVAGIADFNGDGTDDVLWRNAATGANAVWRGGSSADSQHVDQVSTDWKVAGVGDFNGDGQADVLWRNTATGGNAIWNGGNSAEVIAVDTVADANWQVGGIGDFNGDGMDDILWRNLATGENVIWRSGNSLQAQAMSGVGDTDWKIAAVADFNGDGADDVLWRHATTGDNVIWRSGDSSQAQAVTGAGTDWKVAGAGDYDGDGMADILWRNTANGDNAIWQSANAADGQFVAAAADPQWTIQEQDNTWLNADGTYGV